YPSLINKTADRLLSISTTAPRPSSPQARDSCTGSAGKLLYAHEPAHDFSRIPSLRPTGYKRWPMARKQAAMTTVVLLGCGWSYLWVSATPVTAQNAGDADCNGTVDAADLVAVGAALFEP